MIQQEPITMTIKRRKWRWVTFGGDQKATLPEQHWSGTPKDNAGDAAPASGSKQWTPFERKIIRLTWEEVKKKAQVRDGWWSVVEAYVPNRHEKD